MRFFSLALAMLPFAVADGPAAIDVTWTVDGQSTQVVNDGVCDVPTACVEAQTAGEVGHSEVSAVTISNSGTTDIAFEVSTTSFDTSVAPAPTVVDVNTQTVFSSGSVRASGTITLAVTVNCLREGGSIYRLRLSFAGEQSIDLFEKVGCPSEGGSGSGSGSNSGGSGSGGSNSGGSGSGVEDPCESTDAACFSGLSSTCMDQFQSGNIDCDCAEDYLDCYEEDASQACAKQIVSDDSWESSCKQNVPESCEDKCEAFIEWAEEEADSESAASAVVSAVALVAGVVALIA